MPNTALCEYRRNRTILVFFTHPGFLHIHLECPERDFLSGGHPRPERDVTYHVPRWSPQPAYLVEEYIVEHSPRYHLFRVSTGSLSDANIFCFILDRAFLSVVVSLNTIPSPVVATWVLLYGAVLNKNIHSLS